MTKLEAAVGYASRGWKVFPCAPNTKTPLPGITHGVKDASDDIQTVTNWWTANPDANIGLACGDPSGVWVVDVDVRPDKGINGYDSIREAGLSFKRTLMQKTPSGGRHFLFRCEGEKPANKNGFLSGVDIRGTGYYIVVAPSSINGNMYEWDDYDYPMEEYPEDFKPVKVPQRSVLVNPIRFSRGESGGDIDRARAYISQIPGAVQGSNGHGTLFWVAQVLVNGFRLSDSDALDLMWNEFNPRCFPPWDRNSYTEREFMHKVAEAHSKPNAEACAIYNASSEFDADFDYDKCIASVRGMLAAEQKDEEEKEDAPVQAPPSVKSDLMDILVPDGLVGDIARWMNDTAVCQQPLLSLGASLTLCGAIMGRKVCDESNGRTNIFCMGIGPSSSGKDHPGDCINKILTTAGAQTMLMGRMTSDSAIEKALLSTPSKIAVMDEVGHFFSTINAAGDGASYLKTIKPTLMELFSSAHKTYIGKEKAADRPPIIDQPCMCLWGVTAPEKLYSGMTLEELQDGWIARNLIFIASNEIPDIVMKPSADVPQSIADSVRAWVTRSGGDMIISATAGGIAKPLVVRMDNAARAKFEQFNRMAREKMRSAMKDNERTQYLWGKALQNARRVALIVACGREFENPEITEYDAEYGCRLVRFLIGNTIAAIAENVSENRFEEEKNRLRKLVASAGRKGISKTELTRKSQWARDAKTRNGYLSDLADAGIIRLVKTIGGMRWMKEEYARQIEAEEGVDHVDAE